MFGWLRKEVKAVKEIVSDQSDGDYQTAALDAIYDRVDHLNDLGAWIDRREDRAAIVANAKKKNENIREWAATLEDKRFASAVCEWIDHYDNGIREYEEEMRTNRKQREHERYDAEIAARNDRIKKLFPVIPKP